MKAMTLTGIRQMALREAPEPRIENDSDVLLDVAVVGVCGSDVHYYTTGRIGSQVVKYPFRVGHEFSGVVVKTGSAVTRVKAGDVVAVDPAISCGACDQCRGGRPHTCRRLRFLGCPGQAEGCLCERIVMPEQCCFPAPRGMTATRAALLEPLAIGVYAARAFTRLSGARVGILGCGPIGLSVMLAARADGAAAIYATDRIDARAAVARRAGADWAGNPDSEDAVAAVAAREPLLLDTVFECCGQQDAMDQAVEMLKPGGSLILVGIPEVDRVSFQIDLVRRRELRIQNVRRQNERVEETMELVASGRADPDFMATHRFPLARTKEAFDLVSAYGDGVIKAMIDVRGEANG
ncbi:MAG: zinc-binding dehydrogenase [Lentisphaerae bacterium]|nr:zinc-binding dehydrogenase [Lentisphaerota bacterium]